MRIISISCDQFLICRVVVVILRLFDHKFSHLLHSREKNMNSPQFGGFGAFL